MLRFCVKVVAVVAVVLGLGGCASAPGPTAGGQVGETFVVKGGKEPVHVLSPGSVSVATNDAMPVLRVEAFRSEERKP